MQCIKQVQLVHRVEVAIFQSRKRGAKATSIFANLRFFSTITGNILVMQQSIDGMNGKEASTSRNISHVRLLYMQDTSDFDVERSEDTTIVPFTLQKIYIISFPGIGIYRIPYRQL